MGKNSYDFCTTNYLLIILKIVIEFEFILGEGILGEIDERWEAINRWSGMYDVVGVLYRIVDNKFFDRMPAPI